MLRVSQKSIRWLTRPLGPCRGVATAHLDFKFVRDNVDSIEANCRSRNMQGNPRLVADLYGQSVANKQAIDGLRAERKQLSKDRSLSADEKRARGAALKQSIGQAEEQATAIQQQLLAEGLRLPNTTHPDSPVGAEEAAVEVGQIGSRPPEHEDADKETVWSSWPPDHGEILDRHGLWDPKGAVSIAGAGFTAMTGMGALLEMALVQWAMATLHARYELSPVLPPDVAHVDVLAGCGFNPRGHADDDAGSQQEHAQNAIYRVEDSELVLTGTSEVGMAGLLRDRILEAKAAPLASCAYSHCFRRERGSGGLQVRGLYRLHQFSKVEMFVACDADQAELGAGFVDRHEAADEGHFSPIERQLRGLEDGSIGGGSIGGGGWLQRLVAIQLSLLRELGLHCRVLDMPTEELGAAAHRKYDVEAWMPGRQGWGEVCSASDCTDYQARRLNIRKRFGPKDNRFVHTLNGTGLAVPRVLLALLEMGAQPDGSVRLPPALHPFLGGVTHLPPLTDA